MNSSVVVYNNVSQAAGGIATSVQASVFLLSVIILVIGLVLTILGSYYFGFFLFSKSKQKQQTRKIIRIVLLIFGVLGILGGMRGLIIYHQVPTIINNTLGNYTILGPPTVARCIDSVSFFSCSNGRINISNGIENNLSLTIEQNTGKNWMTANIYFFDINQYAKFQKWAVWNSSWNPSGSLLEKYNSKVTIPNGLKSGSAVNITIPLQVWNQSALSFGQVGNLYVGYTTQSNINVTYQNVSIINVSRK